MWGMGLSELGQLAGAIAFLVFMEGLLSADNALVLAVMVRHLPKEQQKRALRYGIFGAFFFRFVAVLFAASLLEYWGFKFVGGLYLLYLSVAHFLMKHDHGEQGADAEVKSRFGKGFWGTVVGVELADIAFSVDSILAAVAIADNLPKTLGSREIFHFPLLDISVDVKMTVIYIGGVLGIIAMRYVAGYFIILLDKFTGLAAGAYGLVGWIGLKLIGGGLEHALHPHKPIPPGGWRESVPAWAYRFPWEMHPGLFWGVMALIVVASMLYKPKNAPRHGSGEGLVAH